MDLSRYLELYRSEAREHLRVLSDGLLLVESSGGVAGVEEAFRAAHTIKGMAATMGYPRVAALAHALEDRLEGIRGGARVDAALIDELLRRSDELRDAVDEASEAEDSEDAAQVAAAPRDIASGNAGAEAHGRGGARFAAEAAAAAAALAPPAPPPEGTALVVRVRIDPAAPLPAARALIARQNVARVAELLGSDPEDVTAGFGGELRLFLAGTPDPQAVESAVRLAGDVESVAFEGPAARRAAARRAEAARSRHLRVDQRHLDALADGIGELSVLTLRLRELTDGEPGPVADLADRVGALLEGLQGTTLAMRMVPVDEVLERFPRMVRDAARALEKQVEFRLEGRDIELDRSVLDEIADPLVHLLRNAVDHGLESAAEREAAGKPAAGLLVLSAVREQSTVVIRVRDDGRGVDAARVVERARELGLAGPEEAEPATGEALLRLLALPGLSTARQVTQVSGRGVGMNAVVERVRALGGSVDLRTTPGGGSTFTLRLPITLAVASALRVRVAGEDYAVPMTHVSEAVDLLDGSLARVRGREVLRLRGEVVPLLRLSELLEAPAGRGGEKAALIAEVGERRTALAVDELVAREQVVVKGFDPAVGTLPFFSGVTLLADGRPALVLDPMNVI